MKFNNIQQKGYTCCGIDLSTATVALRCTCSSVAFSMGHNAFRDRPAPTCPHPRLQSLQGCTCSVLGLSMATRFEVLQHDLMHSHRCFEILSPIPVGWRRGWRLNHFPGQSVPMLDNPPGEEKFPNIQSKPPLAQLEAISSCPITCYLGEETDPHLSTTSFQVVVESDEVSPQPPFLQAKQSHLPQPLLIRLLLQTLHQLRCPSLYTLQYLNIPLVVGGPKLNTVFEVRPHQCRVQGHNHFPSPAGHAIFDTGQDAIGLLGRLGTLLAHIQAAVNQHPQVLLCQAAFQPLFPKPVALHGVAVTQVQDLALGLVEPHTIGLGPSIQPVQVPLQSLPPLKHFLPSSTSPQHSRTTWCRLQTY
ncbi:hypothetical protein QYF61_001087 [Mycteria americana]|uniref:Uncharacterized protein n=1 Tax=Mycteria americana TaxID=33587 RepID=A0AAN7RGT8_MYCAM|nr:hypothetical protein QYF61_001087 [Mycteria americana]